MKVAQRKQLSPCQQFVFPVCTNTDVRSTTGTADASSSKTRKEATHDIPTMVGHEHSRAVVPITYSHCHWYTVCQGAVIAILSVFTSNRPKHVKLIAQEQLYTLQMTQTMQMEGQPTLPNTETPKNKK